MSPNFRQNHNQETTTMLLEKLTPAARQHKHCYEIYEGSQCVATFLNHGDAKNYYLGNRQATELRYLGSTMLSRVNVQSTRPFT